MEGLKRYKEDTESLYKRCNESNNLINFGVPIRYNEETTTTINAVRRCIDELNKWMEEEINRTSNLPKWEKELRQIFPNLNETDKNLVVKAPDTSAGELLSDQSSDSEGKY